jgi:hypothetical protein
MKLSTLKLAFAVASIASIALSTGAQAASFNPFIIRTIASPTTPLTITDVAGVVTTNVDESGEKTGYGTSAFDGQTISALTTVTYNRIDAGPRDPYLNIWITNGVKSAVIAPVVGMTGTGGYTSNNINGLNLQTLGFNIYETDFSDLSWLGIPGATRVASALVAGGNAVTLSQISGLTIQDPGVGNYSGFVGTGAPKNGTGLNLIFGDTQGNFSQPLPYVISNVAVPEPTTLAVVAGASALGLRRRRA